MSDNIIDLPPNLRGAKTLDDLLEEKQQTQIKDVINKVSEVTQGLKANDVVIACLERVMQVCRQEGCPPKFKIVVISMMAGIIRELTQ